jgi:hypothetical protein
MASQEATTPAAPEPFQFRLRSIFLATAAVGVALGLLHWFGAVALILAVQFSAVVAILVISRGTALRGVVIVGGFVALYSMLTSEWPVVAFGTSLTAWFGGALTADADSKRRSFFLRWAWLFALIWPLIVVLIEIMTIALR